MFCVLWSLTPLCPLFHDHTHKHTHAHTHTHTHTTTKHTTTPQHTHTHTHGVDKETSESMGKQASRAELEAVCLWNDMFVICSEIFSLADDTGPSHMHNREGLDVR